MSESPVYVISDIHLGAVPESTEIAFRRFLDVVRHEASELLINGDLFDFWFEYRTVVPARHYRVLAGLAEVADAGVRIRFLGGNHDAWGGRFLRDEVGIEILPDHAVIDLAGMTALVVHGDGVGSGDLGYRALKRFIRNPMVVRIFRFVHPDWGDRLARFVSTTEDKAGNAGGTNPVRAEQLRQWARAEIEGRSELDLVLAGHTHTPVVEEVRPGRYYVNTGDWINHFTYLVLARGCPPELRVWETKEGRGGGQIET
ncbi:MAG: UDP-2,3-diacylglucosamine diphosphatase [Gemmatimonas sp.]|nr:UDP-2,3-diacylglucosamine diphosphatase [Gemmatimonas sp.]